MPYDIIKVMKNFEEETKKFANSASEKAKELVKNNAVKILSLTDHIAVSQVLDGQKLHECSMNFSDSGKLINYYCDCNKGLNCEHIPATLLYLSKLSDEPRKDEKKLSPGTKIENESKILSKFKLSIRGIERNLKTYRPYIEEIYTTYNEQTFYAFFKKAFYDGYVNSQKLLDSLSMIVDSNPNLVNRIIQSIVEEEFQLTTKYSLKHMSYNSNYQLLTKFLINDEKISNSFGKHISSIKKLSDPIKFFYVSYFATNYSPSLFKDALDDNLAKIIIDTVDYLNDINRICGYSNILRSACVVSYSPKTLYKILSISYNSYTFFNYIKSFFDDLFKIASTDKILEIIGAYISLKHDGDFLKMFKYWCTKARNDSILELLNDARFARDYYSIYINIYVFMLDKLGSTEASFRLSSLAYPSEINSEIFEILIDHIDILSTLDDIFKNPKFVIESDYDYLRFLNKMLNCNDQKISIIVPEILKVANEYLANSKTGLSPSMFSVLSCVIEKYNLLNDYPFIKKEELKDVSM